MPKRHVNILLVEDNAGDVRLITEMLKETGFAPANLITLSTLKQVLAQPLDPSAVAMVLLDLNLPDSQGISTLAEVMDPYSASAIIVLTGLDDEELAMEALRYGAQNYLTKGQIGSERLDRELRYAVERHGFVMRLREADSELIARERRFRSLVEHSSDLTLMLDTQSKILYASPSVHRTFGHIRLGETYFTLLAAEELDKAQAAFHLALEHPERAVPVTVQTRAQGGKVHDLEGTITNLQHYKAVSAIVINLHDVTQRVSALEEVVSERNNKKALIDSSKDLIWSVDRSFNIITANQWFLKTAQKLAGITELPGTPILPLLSVGHFSGDQWASYFHRALAGESFMVEECSVGPRSGWGEFSFNPIVEGELISGVACSYHNITNRKVAEQHIRALNAGLEQRVKERTGQLLATNAELETEIVKNHRLSDMLAAHNRDLMDGINYARHIQDALFPVTDDIPFFTASACLSLPRDVVSGDFVWYHQTPDHLMLAVADCTGHGVPGALMSMLGHSLLNQVVVERHLTNPAEILTAMDEALRNLFAGTHTNDQVNDGMDMGLLSVDKRTNQLHFAGALIPCRIIRDGTLHHLACSRSPLGGQRSTDAKEFPTVQMTLLPRDRVVMYSDGYQSQFGGPDDRKFNRHRLRALLEQSAALLPVEAVRVLADDFHAWKGDREQVDDVVVMILDV